MDPAPTLSLIDGLRLDRADALDIRQATRPTSASNSPAFTASTEARLSVPVDLGLTGRPPEPRTPRVSE